MKTTVDISDGLLAEAKAVAQRDGTTLRALLEGGLRHELETRRSRAPFVLRDASFSGNGVQPEFAGAGWERLREAAYDDRGA